MQNGTILQCFHWYLPADGQLWNFLRSEAKRLADMGITAVWLPPVSKGSDGANSVGYDVYDLYDLGEFDQKGSVRTRYGTKDELVQAVQAIHDAGMQVYIDVVINHLAGADETETIKVRKVNPDNRTEFISDEYEIEGYTKFIFPARKNKYSAFKWDHLSFSGIDYDKKHDEKAIFTIQNEYGEGWEDVADNEYGNYDYLMCADIKYRNPAVRDEIKRWGDWLWELIQFDGVRLDAVKHIAPDFIKEWLEHVNRHRKQFAVGEYWAPEKLDDMLHFIDIMEGKMSLFDAPLHHNFFNAAKARGEYDLRTIFDNTLVQRQPHLAVTLVGNHDTQPLQLLEAPVEDWFKQAAYSLILLRKQGYPCVFYPDIYGAKYTDKDCNGQDCDVVLEPVPNIEKLLQARKLFAHGAEHDYFDFPTCIGWVREGCAVVISSGDKGVKKMEMGKQHSGRIFRDYLGNHKGTVMIDQDGWGEFMCEPASVSVWVHEGV